MIYRDFQDLHLSLLGFGTMRLPTTVDGAIDEDTTQAMVDYALAHGVNSTPPGPICKICPRRW